MYHTLDTCRSDFYQAKRGKWKSTIFLKGFFKILEFKR